MAISRTREARLTRSAAHLTVSLAYTSESALVSLCQRIKKLRFFNDLKQSRRGTRRTSKFLLPAVDGLLRDMEKSRELGLAQSQLDSQGTVSRRKMTTKGHSTQLFFLGELFTADASFEMCPNAWPAQFPATNLSSKTISLGRKFLPLSRFVQLIYTCASSIKVI